MGEVSSAFILLYFNNLRQIIRLMRGGLRRDVSAESRTKVRAPYPTGNDATGLEKTGLPREKQRRPKRLARVAPGVAAGRPTPVSDAPSLRVRYGVSRGEIRRIPKNDPAP